MKKTSSLYGFGKVFSFTLTQQLRAKGYKIITILLAVLCFLLPAVIMPLVEINAKDDKPDEGISPVTQVYVVDNTSTPTVDFNFLSQTGDERFAHIVYINCPDGIDEASKRIEDDKTSLILALDEDTNYRFTVLRTKDSDISRDDARALQEYINQYFRLVLCEKAGISYEALAELSVPVRASFRRMENGQMSDDTSESSDGPMDADDPAAADNPIASMKSVLSFLLPYVNIMLLYFLVLFYGQNVANCVIMEKTSKLMDTFLVSVKPAAMIFGKVFAIISASVIQFLSWVVALIGGFAVGSFLVKMANPDSDMVLLAFFDLIGKMTGMFSIPGAIIALLMIVAAFALYCGLAAIGGSLASKPEDLSSTNSLFTLILIISFFATIATGAMTGSMPEAATWYDFVPFTSILVTPSRILLGYVPLAVGCLSLVIVLAAVVLCLMLAGKLYKMMSLYKGNVPKPSAIIAMMKNK